MHDYHDSVQVIPMKEGTAWHKGRLGKDSNAEKLIELHKSGMSVSLEMAKLEQERDNKAMATLQVIPTAFSQCVFPL
jgi:hypothetical protein